MKVFIIGINKIQPKLGDLVVNSPDNNYLSGVLVAFSVVYTGFSFDQWEVKLLSPRMKIDNVRLYVDKAAVSL
jgi:hypothetical protein